MFELKRLLLVASMAIVGGCRQSADTSQRTGDLESRQLDLRKDVEYCPVIVEGLVRQVDGKDIDPGDTGRPAIENPMRPWTVDIEIIQVLKGSVSAKELQYLHYSRYSPIIAGPPQGASGEIGTRALFFLKEKVGGGFRSCVDSYRPDISVQRDLPSNHLCRPNRSLRMCLAEFTYTSRSFEKSDLMVDTGNIQLQSLLGRVGMYDYLEHLSREGPDRVASELRFCKFTAAHSPLFLDDRCKRVLLKGREVELLQKGINWAVTAIQRNGIYELIECCNRFGKDELIRAACLMSRNANPFLKSRGVAFTSELAPGGGTPCGTIKSNAP